MKYFFDIITTYFPFNYPFTPGFLNKLLLYNSLPKLVMTATSMIFYNGIVIAEELITKGQFEAKVIISNT